MRRHELDLTSLVWGLLFLVAAGFAVLVEVGDINVDLVDLDGRWVLVAALLLVGGLGLATSLRRLGRGGEKRRDDETATPDQELSEVPVEDPVEER